MWACSSREASTAPYSCWGEAAPLSSARSASSSGALRRASCSRVAPSLWRACSGAHVRRVHARVQVDVRAAAAHARLRQVAVGRLGRRPAQARWSADTDHDFTSAGLHALLLQVGADVVPDTANCTQ